MEIVLSNNRYWQPYLHITYQVIVLTLFRGLNYFSRALYQIYLWPRTLIKAIVQNLSIWSCQFWRFLTYLIGSTLYLSLWLMSMSFISNEIFLLFLERCFYSKWSRWSACKDYIQRRQRDLLYGNRSDCQRQHKIRVCQPSSSSRVHRHGRHRRRYRQQESLT